MPEKILNHADIDALLQQMRGEAMAKRVHGHGLSEPCCISRLATSALHGAAGDRASCDPDRGRGRRQVAWCA